jgi:hypothetical protein
MPTFEIPESIRQLADARRAARIARRYDEADRLKAALETAGWKVTDEGMEYHLALAHPPDVVVEGRLRLSWSGAVPSRAAEPATGIASVVLVAGDRPDDLERALAALAGAVDDGVQRIVVANAPSPEQETGLRAWEERWAAEAATAGEDRGGAGSPEVVWMAERLGAAGALNAGIRRAAAAVVILLDTSVEPIGDFVTPLVRALADPAVAVAGPWGLVSADGRRFEPAEGSHGADGAAVAAIELDALAFRRADYGDLGPLDERFESSALLDAWWSLVLREGPDGGPARRAVIVDVPVVRHAAEGPAAPHPADDERAERRNRYRIIDRFGDPAAFAVPGTGPAREAGGR